jgi:PiT family inorganic phosphate transporter
MLILIGTVPKAYALNRAVPAHYEGQFHMNSIDAQKVLTTHGPGVVPAADPRAAVTAFIADKKTYPDTVPSLSALVGDIDRQVTSYGTIAHVPGTRSKNMRNDVYLVSEAIKRMTASKNAGFTDADAKTLTTYKGSLDKATRLSRPG